MILCFSLASCASVGGPLFQSEINGLVTAGRVQDAAEKITGGKGDYGTGNYVLYYLDRALVLQLSGDLAGSIASLEKAKARHEELYTRSVTNEALTWVVNDNRAPYRAPTYERVLMNVFQMFNYLQMNELDEALIEARDLDAKFPVVPELYARDKRRFEDNGFARVLCGVLYEATGTGDDMSDAFIAYRQALAVYDAYYDGQYVPRVLQERLVRLARKFNDPDLGTYRARFPGAFSGTDRVDAATVYLLGSVGFSPVKAPWSIPVPLEDGVVARISFPQFMRRAYAARLQRLVLQGSSGIQVYADAEIGVDIEELAEKDLESRKALTLAKAIARPAFKYLVERNQKEAIEKKHGALAGEVFGLFSSLYNIYSEQADLRSWQALPAQVHVARVQVPAGTYHVSVEDLDAAGSLLSGEDKGDVTLKAGQTYFFIRRTLR
jgi:hypothetical protein